MNDTEFLSWAEFHPWPEDEADHLSREELEALICHEVELCE